MKIFVDRKKGGENQSGGKWNTFAGLTFKWIFCGVLILSTLGVAAGPSGGGGWVFCCALAFISYIIHFSLCVSAIAYEYDNEGISKSILISEGSIFGVSLVTIVYKIIKHLLSDNVGIKKLIDSIGENWFSTLTLILGPMSGFLLLVIGPLYGGLKGTN